MTTGIIFDIQRFSIHDGPGIRTTVFLKGCPLACWWCHNPESQTSEPELTFRESRCIRCGACLEACVHGAISLNRVAVTDRAKCRLCGACVEGCYTEARQMIGQAMTTTQVMAEIQRDVVFYDQSGGGATFSGGEPLLQAEFLLSLLRSCREKAVHTALDTCGYAPWEVVDRVREYVDLFLYDLKLVDEARHQQFTGASNVVILQNLRLLSKLGQRIVLRVPVVPGVNDDDASARQIAAFAAELPYLQGVHVLPYHHVGVEKYDRLNRAYAQPTARPPSAERMARIRRILEDHGLRVNVY